MYEPYLDRLTKLGFLASGIHQLVFTARSALPFAVGQVQVRKQPHEQVHRRLCAASLGMSAWYGHALSCWQSQSSCAAVFVAKTRMWCGLRVILHDMKVPSLGTAALSLHDKAYDCSARRMWASFSFLPWQHRLQPWQRPTANQRGRLLEPR